MSRRARSRLLTLGMALGLFIIPAISKGAEFSPAWVSRAPLGASLSAGAAGIHVDPDGVSYIPGTSGASSSTDITTTSFAPDGSLRWSKTFNGPTSGADQAGGIARGPGNLLYVVGNTAGPDFFANLLVLTYDATNGALLQTIVYSTQPGTSEFGSSIVADSAGNIYVTGGTVGDGVDVLTLKFDSIGALKWKRTWDGAARSPFSGDAPVKVLLDPNGDVVVAIYGVAASNHPDYVVVKYAPSTGVTLWETSFGVSGDDSPIDMEIDSAGDIYVTGTGIDFINKYSTIKLRGSDGQLLWQFYDAFGQSHAAKGLFLDGQGGVLITGSSDPDGDQSNLNDQFFTVKRDATTGAQLWTHVYGATCVGCYDVPSDVRVDSAGNAFVIGRTSSAPYSNDVILFVLDNATGVEKDRGLFFNTGTEIPTPRELRFDAAFNIYNSGQIYDANTGAIDMSVTKWASRIGGGGGGIPCADLVSFRARCKATSRGHTLQAQLTLTNANHAGESVTVTVDGAPFVLTINGSKAQLSTPETTTGPHTIELVDPAGCFPPQVVNCPAD